MGSHSTGPIHAGHIGKLMIPRTFILLLALAWPAWAADLEVKVVGISDGDTVLALDEKKNEIKVRLAGIDAPEFRQAFGTKSKEALSAKVFGKRVTLESHGEDDFGRTLGKLKIDDRNINLEMVAEGWAWQYVHFDKSVELRTAQERAKKMKLGLWADDAPLAPWDYRRANPKK